MQKKWWYPYRCPDCQRRWSNTGQPADPPLVVIDGEVIGYAFPQTKLCETCIEWTSACEAALAAGQLPPLQPKRGHGPRGLLPRGYMPQQ